MGNRKKLKSPQARVFGGKADKREESIKRMYDIQSTFSGKYNGYICRKCDKGFLTLDIDHGATPYRMRCFATEGCGGVAESMGYPEGDPPETFGPPIIHWVKDESRTDGLLKRQASSAAPDWVKEAV